MLVACISCDQKPKTGDVLQTANARLLHDFRLKIWGRRVDVIFLTVVQSSNGSIRKKEKKKKARKTDS